MRCVIFLGTATSLTGSGRRRAGVGAMRASRACGAAADRRRLGTPEEERKHALHAQFPDAHGEGQRAH
jgi:hypothetical protein